MKHPIEKAALVPALALGLVAATAASAQDYTRAITGFGAPEPVYTYTPPTYTPPTYTVPTYTVPTYMPRPRSHGIPNTNRFSPSTLPKSYWTPPAPTWKYEPPADMTGAFTYKSIFPRQKPPSYNFTTEADLIEQRRRDEAVWRSRLMSIEELKLMTRMRTCSMMWGNPRAQDKCFARNR